MSASSRFRLSALLAGAAVIAASVLPAFPAAADDTPTPDPTSTVAPVETPAPDATPTAEPTPDATATPDATPAPDATPTEEPSATPSPTATPDAAETVSYSGMLNRIADETSTSGPPSLVLSVTGRGYLLVDASGLPQANRGGKITASIVVPTGLTLSSDPATRFTQLAKYASTVKPLKLAGTATQLSAPKEGVAQSVSVTPVTIATHKVYVVLVSPKEKQTKGSNQTAAEASTLVQAADDYWNRQSSGTIGFSLAGTASWYKSDYSCKTNAGSTALWNQAASVAKSKLGYVQGPNTHLVLLFPSSTNCGGAIGLGTIGWSVNQGGVLWVVGGNNIAIRKATITHELGHNLSLGHADYLACNSASPVVGTSAVVYATNTTAPGISGCTVEPYGDLTDVMGYGQDGFTGGALSSPNAIRSGIWTSAAYYEAGLNTNSYTINAVGTNTGKRAVVVQDDDGTNYFVEFRNFQGDDLQYDKPDQLCYPDSCVSVTQGTPGVRILRLEPSGFNDNGSVTTGWQGLPGYDAYLIGRTTGEKVRYLTGETFWSKAGNTGIKVQVTGMTSSTATVSITRATHANTNDYVYVESTRYYDNTYRVGDTLTAFLGDDWDAETNAYQWQRADSSAGPWTSIGGATGSSYVLTWQDEAKYIRVNVTGSSSGQSNVSNSGVLGVYQTNGSPVPVAQGIYIATDPGSVVVDNSTGSVKAVDSNFPGNHTAFSYQWYRGTTAIPAPAGTGQFYNLVAADANQLLKVKISTTIPGYSNTVSRTSPARNLTIKSSSGTGLNISGNPRPGDTLTVTNNLSYTGDGAALTPSGYDYVWLRNGVAITGVPNAATYLVQSADFGKKITVKVTANKAGWVSGSTTSSTGPTINVPAIFVHNQYPSVTADPLNPLKKTVNALPNDVVGQTQPGWFATSFKYQWYRNNVAITGATTATYTLSQSLDYGKQISVRVQYLRTGFTTYSQYGVTTSDGLGNFWIRANSTVPVLLGAVKVGNDLTVDPRTYFDMTNGGSTINSGIVEKYQWYRSGVPIPVGEGGNLNHYQLGIKDKGKTITVKMTVTAAGYEYDLPSISTSAATQVVGSDLLPGYDTAAPTLTVLGTSTPQATTLGFTSTVGAQQTGITSPGGAANTVAYQWYRVNKTTGARSAITGATKSTYLLTQADRNVYITLRIITSHAAIGSHTYTTDVRYTDQHDFTLTPSGAAQIVIANGTDPFEVGTDLAYSFPSYFDAYATQVTGFGSPQSIVSQWYRNGVAIPGATAQHYVLVAADAGAKITVRSSVGKPGYIPSISTWTTMPATLTVPKGTLVGATTMPTVTTSATLPLVLTAVPPSVHSSPSSTPQNATLTYQWLREGAAISGATASTYTPTTADYAKHVSVRITASLAGYNTATLPDSVPTDYSISEKAGDQPYPSGSSWTLGTQIAFYNYDTFTTKDGDLTTGTVTFQWLRAGVPIPGATNETYDLQLADYNKLISMRYTVKAPGYMTFVHDTNGYPALAGHTVTSADGPGYLDPTVSIVPGSGTGVLQVQINDLYPATPVPAYAYKWYRGATVITGATASTYKLVAADKGQQIKVVVTVTRTNFEVPVFTLTSGAADYTIYANPALVPSIAGTTAVGEVLQATPPTFYDDDTFSTAATGLTYTYTWYRSGAVITGATADTYTLVAADKNAKISVKVTASKAGRLAATSPLSAVSGIVAVGTIQPGTLAPAWNINLTTRKATITFTGSAITTGTTVGYQWYRNGVAISGATASTFILATTDTNKSITVTVKLTKSGFTAYSYFTAPGQLVNGFSQGEGAAVTGWSVDSTHSTVGAQLACVAPFYYHADGTQLLPGTTPGDTQVLQWTRDGAPIAGETAYHYTPVAGDAGHAISCTVTNGATLHKTSTDTSANVVDIS